MSGNRGRAAACSCAACLGWPDGESWSSSALTLALGASPHTVQQVPQADISLHGALTAADLDSHAIGDCTGLGLIVKATYDGAEIANWL